MRPKKQNRDVLLNVRVTKDEANLLRKEAAKRGVSVSELLRTVPTSVSGRKSPLHGVFS